MGYAHIPKKHAKRINVFYREDLNPYVNFHRYSAFATDYINEKGKIKKKYEIYMTPIQKLLSIPNCEQYFREGVTKESLIEETNKMTHFEAAQKVFEARQQLFKEINRKI